MASATQTTIKLNARQTAVLKAFYEANEKRGLTLSQLAADWKHTLGIGTTVWPKNKADWKKAIRTTTYQLVEHGYLKFEQRARSQGYLFFTTDRRNIQRALKAAS